MSYTSAHLGDVTSTDTAMRTPAQDEAQLLYANGQQAFGERRYESALNAFMQAYRVISNPTVLIAIGRTQEQLAMQAAAAGNTAAAAVQWSNALGQYRAYLAAAPDGAYAVTAHERIATLTAPVKEPSGAPMVAPPLSVPSLVVASGPRVSGVVIAVGIGLVAVAGLVFWRSRTVRSNRRRRVRRNRHSWTHDTDYASSLRELDRSRAKLRQRL